MYEKLASMILGPDGRLSAADLDQADFPHVAAVIRAHACPSL